MGKAWRDIQLPVVVARQNLAHPAAKGGRAASDIDCHIEHLTLEYVHEFALGVCELIMQATQHTLGRVGIVILHKLARNVRLPVPFGLPSFHEAEVPSRIGCKYLFWKENSKIDQAVTAYT
jgi:hypothetical protein